VRGRGIEQLERFADSIDQLPHTVKELCPPAAALRSVGHFERVPLNRVLLLNGEAVPPGRERSNEEVAGLGGTAEGHIQLGRVFLDEPTRDLLLWALAVMVIRFVLTARLPTARERPNLDRGFTVHASSRDSWGVRARLVFFLYWQRWPQFLGSLSVAWLCSLCASESPAG